MSLSWCLYFHFLDHSLTHTNEKLDHDAKEKCGVSRNGYRCVLAVPSKRWSFIFNCLRVVCFSAVDVQKDSGRIRVPVVCLERLKILVSQLPPHGRRQSDPLPASGTERRTWHAVVPEVSPTVQLLLLLSGKAGGS